MVTTRAIVVGALDGATAETTGKILTSESAKQVINQALKVARTKPAISIAATITGLGCLPVAGVAGSPALCIACGLLLGQLTK